MKNKNISKKAKAILGTIACPIALIALWQLVILGEFPSARFLPSPCKVFNTFVTLFSGPTYLQHIAVSLQRVMIGFFIGALTGFLFGLLIGLSKTAEKIFAPFFHAVRQIPMIGWIPLIIMLFGMNELPRVLIIAVAAFYPVTLNTFSGVRNVPREYLELASVYGFKGLKLIRKIIIPAALPSITTGISLGLAMSWSILMVAEIFIQTAFGVGTQIQRGRDRFDIALVVAGIITVGVLGYAMTLLVQKIVQAVERGQVITTDKI
jgi:sulfonate transport system permease protein